MAAGAGSSRTPSASAPPGRELLELRRENEAVVQRLVIKQLEVAELSEEQVCARGLFCFTLSQGGRSVM